jgi:hypothetical protein
MAGPTDRRAARLRPGRCRRQRNGGHRFGDGLTEEERMAVIEYLKTL